MNLFFQIRITCQGLRIACQGSEILQMRDFIGDIGLTNEKQ